MAPSTVVTAPHRLPVVGHGLQLLHRPLPFMESLRRHGDVVAFHMGRTPAYAVTRADLARRVLLGEAGAFHREDVAGSVGIMFGQAVATLGGTEHRERRRLLAPAFRRERIAEHVPLMAEVAAERTRSWRDGLRLDFGSAAFDLALATLWATLFTGGIGEAAAAEIRRSLPFALRQIPRRVLQPPFLLRLPTPANRRFEASALRMRSLLRHVIEEYRSDGTDRGDLLSALLLHTDQDTGRSLSDDVVEDELMGLLVAGTDTPAAAVAWVFHELGRAPGIDARVHAEVVERIGDGPVTPGHVRALTYTRQVIQETLRRYAPWINLLQARTPVDLGAVRLPPGSTVAVSLHMLHHDPRLFPEPGRFDPDRWSQERSGPGRAGPAIPFGIGGRRCPGDAYALTEMTVQVATVVRRWRLEPVPGVAVRPATRSVVVHPDRLPMVVRAR
ncbi:cytochrome P450 [Streptomyces sp. NPDC002004]